MYNGNRGNGTPGGYASAYDAQGDDSYFTPVSAPNNTTVKPFLKRGGGATGISKSESTRPNITSSSMNTRSVPSAPARVRHVNTSPLWLQGPVSTVACSRAHDRPVYTLSVDPLLNIIVSGSADHGQRVFDATSGKLQREQFSKDSGHKEWVTCSSILPSGYILSGGMDSTGCFWNKSGVKCGFFGPHDGPLTKVAGDDKGIVISSSMDKTIQIYNVTPSIQQKTGPQRIAPMLGSINVGNAIVDFSWVGSDIVYIDRVGCVGAADIHTEQQQWVQPQIHAKRGMVVKWLRSNMYISGGFDGKLHFIDDREGQVVQTVQLSGPVNDIAIYGNATQRSQFGGEVGSNTDYRPDQIERETSGDVRIGVACGDGNMYVVDMKKGDWKARIKGESKNFPIMKAKFSPDGKALQGTNTLGELFVYDAVPPEDKVAVKRKGKWGMVVSQGPISDEAKAIVGGGSGGRAVGCLEVFQDSLVCAGDDGTPLLLHFNNKQGEWV